jgi:hypothetical protein
MARQRLAPRFRGDSCGKFRTSMPVVQVDSRAAVPIGTSEQFCQCRPCPSWSELPHPKPSRATRPRVMRVSSRSSLLGKKHRYAHRRRRRAHTPNDDRRQLPNTLPESRTLYRLQPSVQELPVALEECHHGGRAQAGANVPGWTEPVAAGWSSQTSAVRPRPSSVTRQAASSAENAGG